MTKTAPSPTRSDGDVLDLILSVARADPRVRAVVLSGSRADPAAPADPWRDFDVVYVVRDVGPFRADPAWIDVFGERAILQRPDGMVPAPPARGAPRHVPAAPTATAFAEACNEFWWVAPYVAKGLARGELTYARHHLDTVLRAQLMTMLDWEVAAASGFRRGSGKLGRHLRRELPPGAWSRLEATYADADPAHGWAALEAMTALFRTAATDVAARFGFPYPRRDDERVTAHLRRMRIMVGMGDDRPDPLMGELEGELAAWETLLAGRAERALRAPRSAGGWSVHDVVAHLAAWQRVSNARLRAAARGGPPELPGWLAGGGPEDEERLQAHNDRIFTERHDLAWPTVRRAWRDGFRRLIDAAAALPVADLRDPERCAWLDGHPLRAVLEGTLAHHREHRAAVAGWFAAEAAPAVDAFFDGHPEARSLFERVRRALEAVGTTQTRVSRSQVTFRRRRSFAFAWRPGRYLRGAAVPLVLSLALPERDPSPRWKEVAEPTPGRFMHHLELRTAADVDDEVVAWLRRAWAAAGSS